MFFFRKSNLFILISLHADRLMLFVACFLLPLMPLRGKEDKGHKQALSSILTSTFKPSFFPTDKEADSNLKQTSNKPGQT